VAEQQVCFILFSSQRTPLAKAELQERSALDARGSLEAEAEGEGERERALLVHDAYRTFSGMRPPNTLGDVFDVLLRDWGT
jgi:hypothetical protein